MNLKKLVTISLSSLSTLLVLTTSAAAQSTAQEVCEGSGGTWNGSECIQQTDTAKIFGGDSIFQNVANMLLFFVGAISVIMLIVGGIRYVMSAGDPNATKGAKDTIMYALIGIVVAFFAFAVVNWITDAL